MVWTGKGVLFIYTKTIIYLLWLDTFMPTLGVKGESGKQSKTILDKWTCISFILYWGQCALELSLTVL